MDVKISVIIPVYNAEDFLAEALDSVLEQSFREIEVLCVNDGSTDRSGEILQAYSSRDPRVVVVCQENQGPSAARNNGIKRAAGRYIQFLDSDDLLARTDALDCLFQKAESEGLDQLFFDADSFYESPGMEELYPEYRSAYRHEADYPVCKPGKQLFADMQKNWDYQISPVLQLLRRGFLLENDLFFCEDMRNHEDEVFTLQCSILAARAGYIKESLYKRRVHGGSLIENMGSMRGITDMYHGIRRLISFGGEHLQEEGGEVYEAYYTRVRVLQEITGKRSAQVSPEQKRSCCLPPEERADFAAALCTWEHLAELSKSNRWLNNEYRVLREQVRKLQSEKQTLRIEKQGLRSEKQALKDKVRELKADRRRLQEEMRVLKQENESLKSQLSSIENSRSYKISRALTGAGDRKPQKKKDEEG